MVMKSPAVNRYAPNSFGEKHFLHTAPSILELSADEQEHLFGLIHKGHSARVITRARILSKLAKGHTEQNTSQALDVTLATVRKIQKRYTEAGLQGALAERPRPGACSNWTPNKPPW